MSKIPPEDVKKFEELVENFRPGLKNVIMAAVQAQDSDNTLSVYGINDAEFPLHPYLAETPESVWSTIPNDRKSTEKFSIGIDFSNDVSVLFLVRDTPKVIELLSRKMHEVFLAGQ